MQWAKMEVVVIIDRYIVDEADTVNMYMQTIKERLEHLYLVYILS